MQIISWWPQDGRGSALAHFDIEVMDGLRLCGLKLIQNDQGQFRTIAPTMGSRRSVTFHPEVASRITAAAVDRMNRPEPRFEHRN
ncbi:hypothetical protein [Bosea sp. FBZP-16]|uniref:hypothetical protein n=1 Tax=Bosea sp. FBZP-16 TaxID=2065382 RepID=UPI000C308319|nr:hypothetical protein [Bosea sp. FBZP-16]